MADSRKVLINSHLVVLEANTDESGKEHYIIDTTIKRKLGTKYSHGLHMNQWADAWSSLSYSDADWIDRTEVTWNNANELYGNYVTVSSTSLSLGLGISGMDLVDVSLLYCKNLGKKNILISLRNDDDYAGLLRPGESVVMAPGSTVEVPEVKVKTLHVDHVSKMEYLIAKA